MVSRSGSCVAAGPNPLHHRARSMFSVRAVVPASCVLSSFLCVTIQIAIGKESQMEDALVSTLFRLQHFSDLWVLHSCSRCSVYGVLLAWFMWNLAFSSCRTSTARGSQTKKITRKYVTHSLRHFHGYSHKHVPEDIQNLSNGTTICIKQKIILI